MNENIKQKVLELKDIVDFNDDQSFISTRIKEIIEELGWSNE